MWIRNQSKTGLIEVSSVDIKGTRIMCKNWTLGKYESEKRRLEILDRMHDHLNDFKQGYREVFEMPRK